MPSKTFALPPTELHSSNARQPLSNSKRMKIPESRQEGARPPRPEPWVSFEPRATARFHNWATAPYPQLGQTQNGGTSGGTFVGTSGGPFGGTSGARDCYPHDRLLTDSTTFKCFFGFGTPETPLEDPPKDPPEDPQDDSPRSPQGDPAG